MLDTGTAHALLDFLASNAPPISTTITDRTPLGGMQYPYLARTGKAWTITSTPAASTADTPRKPLTRWVNGNDVYDLELAGTRWTKTALAKQLGLRISMSKGGFRASKRWSRLMRPYHMHMHVPSADLHIRYLPKDAKRDKIWDGAGIVSRKLLLKMSDHLDQLPLSPRLRRKLRHELATTQRVEFTIQSPAGQDKGHAIVSETLDDDFLLIQDTKTEVVSTDDTTFIGIVPVHAHNHMHLDIQSLINLHPFWTNGQLLTWLNDSATVFAQSLENGTIDDTMQIIDGGATLDDLEAWHLREYFASRGETLWFEGIIKSLMNQHLKHIRATALDQMRLPIPGGRFYVMPAAVGQEAGLSLHVRRGHVLLDETSASAWVNDQDWLCLPKSPKRAGIAKILGGADNDDALWCHPFTDHDGQKLVLCWRSPNQYGEYVLLKPEHESAELTWFDGTTSSSYPPNDSRQLPIRIDFTTPDYQDLVIQDSRFADVPYSIHAMNETIVRIQTNEGALGMYCNLLMLSQALYGKQPKQPAARLEEIIDASVKTGDDLSQIKDYCYEKSSTIIDSGCSIPKALWRRLSIRRDPETARPHLKPTSHHWLDDLISGIQTHVADFTATRDHLMTTAQPPLEIFQYATEHNLTALGGNFNRCYAAVLESTSQTDPKGTYDLARLTCEKYLLDQQASPTDILLGAIANCYLNHTTDAALWQPGGSDEHDPSTPGIAQLTLQALRRIGLIDQLQTNAKSRVVRYPTLAPTYQHSNQIDLNGVWFNYLRAKGYTYRHMSDVEPNIAQLAKQHIRSLAQNQLRGYTLTLRREAGRLTAYGSQGNLFAYIAQEHEDLIAGNRLTILAAKERDGNLHALCQVSHIHNG